MIMRFEIEGHSMEPALEAGQQFFVSEIGKIKVKDIVVLKESEKEMYLVKRVKAELENGTFIVEGDNAGHSRKFSVSKEQIVGKLSFCYWPLEKFGFVKN